MELNLTETNAADDSDGRAFGLEGNLYLPLVVALLGALGLGAGCRLALHFSPAAAAGSAAVPLGLVAGWIFLLRHGRPSGYDRDWWDNFFGGENFSRHPAEQEELT